MIEGRQSIATIDNPEFINLQPLEINPLMSKCEVKVLYVGENRNKSIISKSVATEMSKTLRGCPIVGYFIEKNEDFGDHGEQLIVDVEGARFNKLTRPYGFIAPDARVWFQTFEDTDEFGNITKREYLMTEGYLWTGQFKECQRVIDEGNPQSMELDEETLKGNWSIDSNRGVEFFIINDAIFSTLCILGEDVEPCFEGASVTSPNVSTSFSKDNEFMNTLLGMMKELRYALNNSKGGLSMENLDTLIVEEVVQVAEEVAEFAAEEAVAVEETTETTNEGTPVENFSETQDKISETDTVEIQDTVEEFAKKETEEEKEGSEEKSESTDEEEEDKKKKPETECSKSEDDEEEKKASACHSLEVENLQNELSELQNKYSLLEEENKKLLAFKLEIENAKKDELINSFYMLSNEDKADVIENKAQYSLDEIESKLSVICVRKKVNFSLDTADEKTETMTFNVESHVSDTTPAWLQRVEELRNRNY